MNNTKITSLTIGNKELTFESGRFALQADGAVLCTYGDLSLLSTAVMGNARDGADFFPLVVDFEVKYYASGKIRENRFTKREGRPTEDQTLMARMIDRPLRPLFPKGMVNDTQIICTLLQTDRQHSAAALGINGASCACLLGGLPLENAVGAVRIGMDESGNFLIDPEFEVSEKGNLDLLVAGTEDAILMVEAGAKLISQEKMLEALSFAHEEIKKICAAQKSFVSQFSVTPQEPLIHETDPTAKEAVDSLFSDSEFDAVSGVTKKEIKHQLHEMEEKLLEKFSAEIEDGAFAKKDLLYFFEKKFAASLRRRVFTTGKRVDGRAPETVRPLHSEVSIFKRLHGSALFQRGETQALSLVTVGGPGNVQIVDDADRPEHNKSYIHHYNFPPYSVGEARPMRGPGRREIGHGALAERAIKSVMPTVENDDFPYAVRVVSEILSCNGSSSMASVCGSTLSLMDAGIPIKTPIAGVAMGLLMDSETGEYKILTDIQGLEDFDGDMDFKVTGDEKRITALQLDIKVKGLKLSLLEEALNKAAEARQEILSHMKSVISEPRAEMSEFAPRVDLIKINPEFIGAIIGKGGENIQRLTREYDVDIDIKDEGLVAVSATDAENGKKVREEIEAICYEPNVGEVFENATVKTITDFGAFVEYVPGKDGLVHISEIANERINRVEDALKLGDRVKVKIIDIDSQDRVKLSIKRA